MANAKGIAATMPPPEWWPKKFIDENEVSRLTDVTVPTLRDWRCRKTRDLPYVKLGAAVRYNPDDVWKWLCANTVQAVEV